MLVVLRLLLITRSYTKCIKSDYSGTPEIRLNSIGWLCYHSIENSRYKYICWNFKLRHLFVKNRRLFPMRANLADRQKKFEKRKEKIWKEALSKFTLNITWVLWIEGALEWSSLFFFLTKNVKVKPLFVCRKCFNSWYRRIFLWKLTFNELLGYYKSRSIITPKGWKIVF